MSTSVTIPALGESVTEGTVTRWLKQVGDQVEADEPLLEVSTDKVDTEIPSPAAGILLEIMVAEDETVEVGAELAVIGDESEAGGRQRRRLRRQRFGRTEEPQPRSPSRSPTRRPTRRRPQRPSLRRAVAAPARRVARRLGRRALPAAPRSPCPRWARPSPRAPSPAGSSRSATRSRSTSRCWRSPPTRSTPRSRPRSPAPCWRSWSPRTRPSRSAPSWRSSATRQSGGAPRRRGAGHRTATADSADTTEQPTAAGDEGGQADAGARRPNRRPHRPRPSPSPLARRTSRPARRRRPRARPALRSRESSGQDFSGYVTPLVRKLAAEHNVDLSSVNGTGVGGRIRKQDVLAAAEEAKKAAEEAEKAAAAPAPQQRPRRRVAAPSAPKLEPSNLRGTTEKMSRLRKTIAKRMVESLQVSAQLTATVEVDVTAISQDPGPGQGRLQGPRGREPVVPAVLHEGRGRGAEGVPEGQRDHRQRGRRDHLPRARSTSASRWTPSAACWCR